MSRSTEGRAWRLVLLMALCSPAALADPSAAERDQALALLKEGLALGEAGDSHAATARLQKAYALVSSPVIGLELARSLVRERRLLEALDAARQAATRRYADTAKTTAARADAGLLIGDLEVRIPTVRFAFDGLPAGLSPAVSLDGSPLGAVPSSQRIDPGPHVVSATLPDGREARVRIEAIESQSVKARLRFVSAPPARPSSRPLRTVGFVAAGAGLVGLAVGTGFGLRARSRHQDALANCPGDVCTPLAFSYQDDARSAATLSTVGFVAGGALLAGGVALILLAPTPSAAPSVALTPAVAPGLLGVRGSLAW